MISWPNPLGRGDLGDATRTFLLTVEYLSVFHPARHETSPRSTLGLRLAARLRAAANLIFNAKQIYWKCQARSASEGFRCHPKTEITVEKQWFGRGRTRDVQYWYQLVEVLSGSHLTKITDRFLGPRQMAGSVKPCQAAGTIRLLCWPMGIRFPAWVLMENNLDIAAGSF